MTRATSMVRNGKRRWVTLLLVTGCPARGPIRTISVWHLRARLEVTRRGFRTGPGYLITPDMGSFLPIVSRGGRPQRVVRFPEKRMIRHRHGWADWVMRHRVGRQGQNWNICAQMQPGVARASAVNNRRSAWTRRLASWPSRSRSATSWPAYGSNSWLPRHKLASPLIFDP
jgi:hypothetical protein